MTLALLLPLAYLAHLLGKAQVRPAPQVSYTYAPVTYAPVTVTVQVLVVPHGMLRADPAHRWSLSQP